MIWALLTSLIPSSSTPPCHSPPSLPGVCGLLNSYLASGPLHIPSHFPEMACPQMGAWITFFFSFLMFRSLFKHRYLQKNTPWPPNLEKPSIPSLHLQPRYFVFYSSLVFLFIQFIIADVILFIYLNYFLLYFYAFIIAWYIGGTNMFFWGLGEVWINEKVAPWRYIHRSMCLVDKRVDYAWKGA